MQFEEVQSAAVWFVRAACARGLEVTSFSQERAAEWSRHLHSRFLALAEAAANTSKKSTATACGQFKQLESLREQLEPFIRSALAQVLQYCDQTLESEALRLRRPDEGSSFRDDLAGLSIRLESLLEQIDKLPSPAVAALGFLALRLLGAMNAMCDAVSEEALKRQGLIGKLCFLIAGSSGWLLAYHYRRALLQDLDTDLKRPWSTLMVLQVATQATINARQLPAIFWLAATLSGTIALQASQSVGTGVLRTVMSLRLRTLLFFALLAAFGKDTSYKEHLDELFRQLPPSALLAWSTACHQLQAASHKAWTFFQGTQPSLLTGPLPPPVAAVPGEVELVRVHAPHPRVETDSTAPSEVTEPAGSPPVFSG